MAQCNQYWDKPLKLYSIYAKPEHPFGTVHKTYEESMESEHDHDHYGEITNTVQMVTKMVQKLTPTMKMISHTPVNPCRKSE